jgi:hypothetical protein
MRSINESGTAGQGSAAETLKQSGADDIGQEGAGAQDEIKERLAKAASAATNPVWVRRFTPDDPPNAAEIEAIDALECDGDERLLQFEAIALHLVYAKKKSPALYAKCLQVLYDNPDHDRENARRIATLPRGNYYVDEDVRRELMRDELFMRRMWVKHQGPRRWREFYMAGAVEGERNDSLTKLAGFLLAIGCGPREMRAQLHFWNENYCTPPIDGREVDGIAQSILKAETRKYRVLQ